MDNPNDLPDAPGLSDFLARDKDKDPPQEPPPTESPDKDKDKGAYAQQMLERLKNPKEVLKHLQEMQAFTTGLSEDKRKLEEKVTQLEKEKEDLELGQYNYFPQNQTTTQQDQTPEEYIDNLVKTRVATERVKEVLEDEQAKNPKEFYQRWGMVQQLSHINPVYAAKTHSAAGVRFLFQKADEEIAKQYRSAALRAIEDLPDDLPPEQAEKVRNKLRGLLGEKVTPQQQPSGAYMPETTGAIRTEPKPVNFDDEISQAVSEGNADKVADLAFKKALNA